MSAKKTSQPLTFPIGLKILLLMFFVLIAALGSYFWIATDLILGDKQASIFDFSQTQVTHLSSEVVRILDSYEKNLINSFKSRVHPVAHDFVQDDILRQKDMIGLFFSDRGSGFEADIKDLKLWDIKAEDESNQRGITAQALSKNFSDYVANHKKELTQIQTLHIINLSPSFNEMIYGLAKFWRTTQGSLFGAIFFRGQALYEAVIQSSEYSTSLVGLSGLTYLHKNKDSIYQQSPSPFFKHIEYMKNEKIDAQTIQLQGHQVKGESLVSLMTIPRTQILLTHEIPLEMAYLPIKKLRDRSLYFVIIALLFGILMALIFSKTITAPIQALAEVAVKVKEGVYKISLRKSKSSDEIGVLNQSFIEMTDELERRRIAIEKEIFNLKMVHESSKEISLERVSKNLIPMVMQRSVELLPLDGITVVYMHREGQLVSDHMGEMPLELQTVFTREAYSEKQTLFDPSDEKAVEALPFVSNFLKEEGGFSFEPHQDRLALLVADEIVMGYILIRKNHKEGYLSPQEEYVLGAIATSVSVTLRNIELVEETADKARLANELKTAQLVQQTLLPKKDPDFERVKLTGFYQSATECGGDWWGYFKLDDTLVVMIADATGHGTAAALVTAAARSAVATISYQLKGRENEFSPAEFLKTMNHALFETTQGSIYMTFFCAAVHMPTGKLRFSNAGHDFPWIYHGSKAKGAAPSKKFIESLVMRGHHIGKQATATYEEKETQLNVGDKLLLFTDGIPELVNQEGEEYGSKRFLNNFVKNAHLSVVELKDQLIGEATAFANEAALEDDLTMVVLEYS
jgi:serine phosphatase RsbU (regulator of sigma subunit)/HAMP domain-containing protein